MKRLLIPSLVLSLALSARVAGAQSDLEEKPLFMGKPYSVPDSVEVLSFTLEAREEANALNYQRVALILQRILDFHTHSVVMVGDVEEERFIGARTWVHDFLKSLPAAAGSAYEGMAGPQARRLVEKAIEQRDPQLLEDAIRRYYLSGEGPAALRALSAFHLGAARFEEAAHYLDRILCDFPTGATNTDFAMLAYCHARSGAVLKFMDLMESRPDLASSSEEILVGGTSVGIGAFLGPLRKAVASRKPVEGEAGWPVFGGSNSRSEAVDMQTGFAAGRWSVPTGHSYTNTDYSFYGPWGRPDLGELWSDHFPIHPVVDRGVMYFHDGFRLKAVNLYNGKEIWSYFGPLGGTDYRTNTGTLLSPAVGDGVVYANLQVTARMPPLNAQVFNGRRVIFYIAQRRLFAIDTTTRKLLWSHEDEMVEDPQDALLLEDINFNSPPLLIGDTIYVAASRRALRFFCYVFAVDARTGRIRWRTLVCTGQQELNLFGRPVKELACGAISERDGVLYCSSNLGVGAAIDRRTGELLWVRGYPQIQVPFAINWHMTPERKPTWKNGAPVVTEDAVYFTPTDSRNLVALDREDGRLRFLFYGGDPERDDEIYDQFLGVGEKYLYVAGPRVLAIDTRTGKVVWRPPQGSFIGEPVRERGSPERAMGRGLVTAGGVATLTQRGLYNFDIETGELLEFGPIEFGAERHGRPPQQGGNLVRGGKVLLVAQRDRIGAFYRWEDIYEELKRRIARDPENPVLALEAGEVYLQAGRRTEAVSAFRLCLKLTAGLPADKGAALESAARKGLFGIHMIEGTKLWQTGKLDAAARAYREARESAPDPRSAIRALLALADYERRTGALKRLTRIYEELAGDLGTEPFEFASLGSVSTGIYALLSLAELAIDGDHPGEAIGYLSRVIADYPGEAILSSTESQHYARERIDRIIADHGREVYAPFEKAALRLLGEGSREKLEEVIRLYPNSRAVDEAAVALGNRLMMEGDYRQASIVLRRILSEFPSSGRSPELLLMLAEALEQRGYLLSAKSALRRLARGPADVIVVRDGARVSIRELARKRLEEARFANLGSERKEVQLPLDLLWTEDAGESSYVRILDGQGIPPAGAENVVYLGMNQVLRAVDGRSRKLIWQREMNGILTKLLFCAGRLVLVNNDTIVCVGATRGEQYWEIPNDAQVRAVAASPSAVFVFTADTRNPKNLLLRAIDPKSGQVLWNREFTDHQAYDVLLVTEEVVGVAARDPAGVKVFDAATGRLRFSVEMAPGSLYREPFLVDSDRLFVAHGNQRFELYDTASGNKVWSTDLPGERFFRNAVPVPGGIFLTDQKESLLLIDAANGSVRWTVPPIEAAPLQPRGEASDLERVFVVRRREKDGVHFAEARDIRTGEMLWRTDMLVSKSADPTPLITDRYLIYNMNSYDFGESAWNSVSIFIDKMSGKVRQAIQPEALEGQFTYCYLSNGFYGLRARGVVALYGSR